MFIQCDSLEFSRHAVQQMFSRKIDDEQVKQVLEKGETIKFYYDDEPYPSRLILGFVKERPLHVLVAENKTENQCIIITVYEPGSEIWERDFKTRRR